MLWLVVDALVRRLADTLATEYTDAVELLSTGDIVAEPFGGERAAIVVEGQFGRLFAWTLTPSGRPALVDLDDFVAQLGGLVIVRRLVDLRRRVADDSDDEAAAAAADQFGERMAAVIEDTLVTQGRQFEHECDTAGSSGARLVVYSYMRLTLVASTKPLALFDCEDVLVDGDIDEALDSRRFELTRDAFIPPIPAQTMSFDAYFRGQPEELSSLSCQRRAVRDALVQRPLNVAAASIAVDAYRDAWLAFWRRRIVHRCTSARTKQPLRFEWRVQLVSSRSHSIVYTDPSPLVETACVQLASAALHQRLAAEASSPADVERHARAALNQLKQLRVRALVPLARRYVEAPPSRSESARLERAMELEVMHRVVRLLSPHLVAALEAAVRGVLNAKRAVVAASERRSLDASGHFFVAARLFSSAEQTLPAEEQFGESAQRVSALAYRYLADVIVDTLPDDVGVAVALTREATAQDPSSEALRAFRADMEERNRIVFGMRSVPDTDSIVIDVQRRPEAGGDAERVRVEHSLDEHRITVIVPLPVNTK